MIISLNINTNVFLCFQCLQTIGKCESVFLQLIPVTTEGGGGAVVMPDAFPRPPIYSSSTTYCKILPRCHTLQNIDQHYHEVKNIAEYFHTKYLVNSHLVLVGILNLKSPHQQTVSYICVCLLVQSDN